MYRCLSCILCTLESLPVSMLYPRARQPHVQSTDAKSSVDALYISPENACRSSLLEAEIPEPRAYKALKLWIRWGWNRIIFQQAGLLLL